jgi:hypothetical protein
VPDLEFEKEKDSKVGAPWVPDCDAFFIVVFCGFFFFFFWFWYLGLNSRRLQMLCHLSHVPSPFALVIYVWGDRCLPTHPAIG